MSGPCSVYLIGYEHATFGYALKVGIANNVPARMATFQTANPDQLELYYSMQFETRELALEVERKFRECEVAWPIRNEWCGCSHPHEALLVLTYITASVLQKRYPAERQGEVRRKCGLTAAFEKTAFLTDEQQDRINERWALVLEYGFKP